jgi:beta-ureidopropionase / N-carbamoyl-L-amino-acid hydrolase
MTTTAVTVRAERLLADLDALAQVGPTPEGGSCRLALSDEDAGGRELVVGWMRALGLDVRVDRIGNVIATRPGRDPDAAPVMTGSHIDTVRTGGRYDGTLGVLAGLEVIRALDDAGIRTRRPVSVAFFTDEEGSRFAPDMLGSLVYVGGLGLETALATVGIDGAVLGEELARIGWAGDAAVPGPAPHAFVELHIEQGPILEEVGAVIGAVTGVQGISWQELTLTGQSNHAGTTPMRLRRDPGYVAAEAATFIRQLAIQSFCDRDVVLNGHYPVTERDGEPGDAAGELRATVGRMRLHPDLVNVVPATATMTVDLRHTDELSLTAAEEWVADHVAERAAAEGVEATWQRLARFAPVAFDPAIVDRVEQAARRRDLPVRRLPSGAGHDAQMLSRVCPTGMVFVPSRDGVSHNPAEYTEPEHLAAGVAVLADVLVALADDDGEGGAEAEDEEA